MLSHTALIWTAVIAGVGWFLVLNMIYALWKRRGDKSASRAWSMVEGKISISKTDATPTHPSYHDVAATGAVIRYHYRVGTKDYEGDAAQIGGKSRAMGIMAKALLKKFPEGRPVDVYYDPADPSHSALEPHGKGSATPLVVFLVVFTAISGVLTAHAIAGKMLMMDNGLPYFALGLPIAALLIAVGSIFAYVMQRREMKAAASWPTADGKIVSSRIVEDKEEVESEDSNGRKEWTTEITYRPEIRFAYRVGDNDYATDTWKPGATVGYGTPKRAQAAVDRYAVGQSVAVHYDPAHPDTAVLEPANSEGAGVILVVGVAFGLAGTLFLWLFTHGHWVNAATGA